MTPSCQCCTPQGLEITASGRVLMDQDHRMACVSRVPIFRDLPVQEQQSIASRAVTRVVRKGEVVQRQGGMPALQIVHGGQIKQVRLTPGGSQRLLRILSPGDFMGEHSVLTGTPSPREAIALTDAQICSLSRHDVQQWLEERPGMAVAMLQAVTRRLEATEAQLSDQLGRTVGERLAEYLADASDGQQDREFALPISKKDLAALLGTTPETLSRQLRALSDQGRIEVGPGRRIVVRDLNGLLAG